MLLRDLLKLAVVLVIACLIWLYIPVPWAFSTGGAGGVDEARPSTGGAVASNEAGLTPCEYQVYNAELTAKSCWFSGCTEFHSDATAIDMGCGEQGGGKPGRPWSVCHDDTGTYVYQVFNKLTDAINVTRDELLQLTPTYSMKLDMCPSINSKYGYRVIWEGTRYGTHGTKVMKRVYSDTDPSSYDALRANWDAYMKGAPTVDMH